VLLQAVGVSQSIPLPHRPVATPTLTVVTDPPSRDPPPWRLAMCKGGTVCVATDPPSRDPPPADLGASRMEAPPPAAIRVEVGGRGSLNHRDARARSAIVWAIFLAFASSRFSTVTFTSTIAVAEQTRRVPMPKYFWYSHHA